MAAADPDRMIRTTVYLTAELLAEVKDVADRRGETAANFIRSALSKALGDHRPSPRGGFLG